ncbi:hypothetical protein M0812_13054 [Anaeramoeba flamelloides]|uniref:Uncharacterized protein n=1 Tax=Anaeramoeba flamelloides TaxID=1746091 RepID=A0AAV7ZIG4_9EUKA|nr:hypothetical protein M0812_13054 [Anaeramoeba flamelloides]
MCFPKILPKSYSTNLPKTKTLALILKLSQSLNIASVEIITTSKRVTKILNILHDASPKKQNLKLEQNHLQDIKDEDQDEMLLINSKSWFTRWKFKYTILGQSTWKLGHKYVVHLISFLNLDHYYNIYIYL